MITDKNTQKGTAIFLRNGKIYLEKSRGLSCGGRNLSENPRPIGGVSQKDESISR